MNEDQKPTKAELIDMLDNMAKSYENLPDLAMQMPATNYDIWSLIRVMIEILRSE